MALHDSGITIQTPRLILRPWRDADLKPFAALNADREVMRHFPAPLTRAESDTTAAFFRARFHDTGWGLWAVELPGVAGFLGFTGLHAVSPKLPFAPAVEVGWRLAARWWNHGYATEAARAVVDFAFKTLKLEELVSMTTPGNAPSRRVMEKLGMTRDPTEDFDHPNVPEGHALRPHVLYRLKRPSA